MPRTSKKDLALAAALDILGETLSISDITYDSLSKATGITKSGLIYHFPDRHSMLVELHHYCAGRWEKELESLAGDSADNLTPEQRYRASMRSMAKNDPLVELLMSIHAETHPDYFAAWHGVTTRWLPDPSDDNIDPDLLLRSLIAQGLWVHDHLNERKLSPANRERITAKFLGEEEN